MAEVRDADEELDEEEEALDSGDDGWPQVLIMLVMAMGDFGGWDDEVRGGMINCGAVVYPALPTVAA
ncbi:hypothetical protein BGZ81_001464 [Podila clonocystis]|nr:hypothetical protein BGZ81_001464 [Podila clonocystis]